MRELGMCDVGEGVDDTFEDIAALISCCKFSNCRHDTEPGCAVKVALKAGELEEARWKMYCSLKKESGWAKSLKKQKKVEVVKKRKTKG